MSLLRRPAATTTASLAALVLLTAACSSPGGSTGGTTSDGACAAPEVALSATEATAGDAVTVAGTNLFTDCYDTGQGGTPPPRTGLDVTLETADGTVVLATVDADPAGTFEVEVRIPADTPPGDAVIVVSTADPEPLAIR
ncbi:hypothetical protein Q9R32_01235 [Actinotalea sp. AC32]|nr:hypothetical protein [Actinotalea sp. AC32]